jgi:hypothetical protein
MNALEPVQPFFTFSFEKQGYDISIIPHSESDRSKLARLAREKGKTQADFCQDVILDAMTFAEF